MSIDNLDFRSGDTLAAADLQTIVDQVRRPDTPIRGDAGIDVRRGPHGQVQLSLIGAGGHVAVANGDIAARSGSAWGAGVVTLQAFDGTNGYSIDLDLDVYNPSKTTMTGGAGILDGLMCWIEKTEQGWWIVSPLECE